MKFLSDKSSLRFAGLSVAVFAVSVIFQCCKKDPDIAPPLPREEEEQYAGGATTVFDVSQNAFGHNAPNLEGNGPDRFQIGNSFFRNIWVIAPSSTTARDGIGPFFNAFSCSGCHSNDGRGEPPSVSGEGLSSMLVRLSIPGTDPHGGPLGDPEYGGQLSNKGIPGVAPEGDVKITYLEIAGFYDDGSSYTIRKPSYEFTNLGYGPMEAGIMFSPRVAPQMPGLGLLEAVDEATILSFADPDDNDKDGVSGRPNYVWDYEKKAVSLGRFGWKANQPGMKQQTAAAFLGDMGITSAFFPDENLTGSQTGKYSSLPNGGSPEISDEILDDVAYYSSTLAVPARRNWKDPQVTKGKELFTSLGCARCHIPSMTTGTHPSIPELSDQKIFPYTDMLLHDMGPGLADGRPDYLATGQEWRTPPLWGTGLIRTVNGHTFLLHDGRARNFEEAILWHGGEAEKSNNNFKKLSKADRDALIAFLESL